MTCFSVVDADQKMTVLLERLKKGLFFDLVYLCTITSVHSNTCSHPWTLPKEVNGTIIRGWLFLNANKRQQNNDSRTAVF